MSREVGASLLLKVGGQLFGIPLARVEAVAPYQVPGPVAFQREEVLGALLHRGQFMGVVDLGRLLGIRSEINPERAVVAVTVAEDGYLGLVAESSQGILREREIADVTRALGRWEGPHLDSSVKYGDSAAHLLDFDSLINAVRRNLDTHP